MASGSSGVKKLAVKLGALCVLSLRGSGARTGDLASGRECARANWGGLG